MLQRSISGGARRETMACQEDLRVNEDLVLLVDQGGVTAWNYRSGRRHALSLQALRALAEPAFRAGCPGVVEALLRAKILRPAGTARPRPWRWDAPSRIFHLATSHLRSLNPGAAPEGGSRAHIDYCESILAQAPPDAFSTRRGEGDIAAPVGPPGRAASLTDLFEARRTNRTFSGEAIAFDHAWEILDETFRYRAHDLAAFAGAGLATPTFRRSAPSGGSLQSCEAYLVARTVRDLAAGVYHYRSHARTLGRVAALHDGFSFGKIFLDQMFADNLAAAVVITCRLDKLMWKYPKSRAYRVALLDAGHLSQNAQLVATARGIRTWPTAAFYDDELARLLDLKADDIEYPLIAIGLGAGELNPLDSSLGDPPARRATPGHGGG